jgi:UDP-N-acetylglucosamine 4,6-dehydratase
MKVSKRKITGTTVAITGGTGSFGSVMANSLLLAGVSEVRIFSRDEAKQEFMRKRLDDPRAHFYLGDVRDLPSVDRALRGVDHVFHAAALKQVPSGEFFPLQSVATNVIGSSNVLDAAVRNGVSSVVCLSTDKAVYPINAMGMSKGLMEKIAFSHAREATQSQTSIMVTRYGNVLYSRGSVIPLFVSQILNKEPITVTDLEMTRFLMSLEESVGLVKFALTEGLNGDLLVRKAPAATVGVLVEALLELFGAKNHEVRVLGFRHGEKKHETLLTSEEFSRSTEQDDFYRVPMDTRDLNYSIVNDLGREVFQPMNDYTSLSTLRLTKIQVQEALLGIPEIKKLVG